MKAIIRVGDLNIANGILENAGRPVLECVRIGDGKMVTADGFMLIVKPTTTKGEGEILVRGETLLKAQSVFGQGSCVVESKGENVTIKALADATPRVIIGDKLENPPFPKYEALYPTDKPIAQIAIGISLLKRLFQCLPPEDNMMIQLRIREGGGTPIEFVAGETSGLIMPMFVGAESEHWHKPEKEMPSAKDIAKKRKATKKAKK
jgi:hypothetical protein